MQSLSAMTDSLEDFEKTRKPKLTRAETIEYMCFLNDERTKLLCESIESGSTDKVRKSKD